MDRIFPPTRYDCAPYKTICQVKDEDNTVTVFIQLSKEETNPRWVPIGELLYKAFMNNLSDHGFIDECIKKSQGV